MEDVRAKVQVPIFFAKERVKFAESWVGLLIAPCEFSVLQMDLFELTEIERVSEADDTTSIDIWLVLILRTLDLVEITGNQPV